ncbi:hypothetical protein CB0940_09854 [Cercospora beticola]|uniref:NmrA-like domain-containing protein n=1 Tax=Cercospora beticola TaxID=122368 RepID=A0A2G5HHJ2_CERBT|nr:hypothetical protein CB0940_09854 [Cercospora beticola]PIA91965.1 hypothetical protein CB0940_09854 [Cercospora beticola]WPB05799.1 hypothetical protein RHO25_010453 [Cercospora beticola]
MATPVSSLRKIIVTGATGKQGGALIEALLARPTPTFEIYAITRKKSSSSAQRLLSRPNVHLVEGDFSNPAAIFSQIKDPWGLFSVTIPTNATKEESQGKAMTAAALSSGIKHIVFTATDRGGPQISSTNPTPIPHFASKYKIEQDIITQTPSHNATYTFLRPVAFFENISNNFLGRAFISMWRLNSPNSKLQLISTSDIGLIAAQAFLHHSSPKYKNQAISLAGEELTLLEAQQTFQSVTGKPLPETYPFLARIIKWLLHEQLGIMFNWFKTHGFGVEVKSLREEYPFLKDFRMWLEEESAWKKK